MPNHLSLYLDYTLMSDDTGTKGHRAGYLLNINPEYDAGKLGRFGAIAWLEFFDAPLLTNDEDRVALIEADYGPYWAYDIPKLGATVQFGWIVEEFPRKGADHRYTQEGYVSLSLDDSKWFGQKQPVLSPFFAWYQDTDQTPGGRFDFGISHDFALADLGMSSTPVLRNIDVIPSFLMEVDNGQLGHHWTLESLRWGVTVSYDLSTALHIPEKLGHFSLSTFIYYRDATIPELYDRWFGGLTLSYSR